MNNTPEELFSKGVEQFHAGEYCDSILSFKEAVKHGYNREAAESYVKEAKLKCHRGCFFKFTGLFLLGYRIRVRYFVILLAPLFVLPVVRQLSSNYSIIQVDIQIYLVILLFVVSRILKDRV